MNERIKEIARKWVWWEGVSGDPCDVEEIVSRYDRELEKFGELIVGECVEIAKHNVMNISTYADAEFVEEQIKQHFGVKE